MHRFLPGILLIQLITLVIFCVNVPAAMQWDIGDIKLLLRIVLPLLLLGISTALWFNAIARSRASDNIAKLKERHAKEREKLHRETAQEKSRVVEDAQKEIVREQRRVQTKANMKIGVAFFAAAGAGLVMLVIELVTFGMMTLMTAGGALGGYFYRGRREAIVGSSSTTLEQPEKPPILINPPRDDR